MNGDKTFNAGLAFFLYFFFTQVERHFLKMTRCEYFLLILHETASMADFL